MTVAQRGTAERWRRDHEFEIAAVDHLEEAIRRFEAVRRRKDVSEAQLDPAMARVRCAVLLAASELGRDELQDAMTNLARIAVAEYAHWLATGEWDAARLADAVHEYVSTAEVLENRRDVASCPPEC